MYGSTVTFKGRTFNVVASSKAAKKKMQMANYLAEKSAVFDFPVDTSILPRSGVTVPGFDKSISLQSTVVDPSGVAYEVYEVMDDPKEPFIRCTCNRKQNTSTAI